MILLFLFLKSNYKMSIFYIFTNNIQSVAMYRSFLTTEAQKNEQENLLV